MKADLHVHTRESGSAPQHWLGELLGLKECYTQAEEAVAAGVGRGMDAVAITNHDTARDAIRMAAARPDRVIPGCEYTVYAGRGRYVHVVALGIDASSHERLMRERRRGLARFTELARSEGLPFFLAHPAWEVNAEKRGIDPRELSGWVEHFDTLETLNGSCPAENVVAEGLARYHRKAAVGGSDAHAASLVGRVWTEAAVEPAVGPGVKPDTEPEKGSIEKFMDCLRAGRVRPGGAVADSAGFAAMTREVLGTFYRRELLKAVGSGSLEAYIERASASDVARSAAEFLLLPGLFWAPQAGTKVYFGELARSAERLRRRLVDLLTRRLAWSLTKEAAGAGPHDGKGRPAGAEERARRWIGGMREIYAAFETRPGAGPHDGKGRPAGTLSRSGDVTEGSGLRRCPDDAAGES